MESFFEKLLAGNVDAAAELCHTDAVWSIPGDPDRLPWAGQHRGTDAIRAFSAQLDAETEIQFLNLDTMVANGGQSYVRGQFGYEFPRSGGA